MSEQLKEIEKVYESLFFNAALLKVAAELMRDSILKSIFLTWLDWYIGPIVMLGKVIEFGNQDKLEEFWLYFTEAIESKDFALLAERTQALYDA